MGIWPGVVGVCAAATVTHQNVSPNETTKLAKEFLRVFDHRLVMAPSFRGVHDNLRSQLMLTEKHRARI
jgi:hypothetical protein